MMIALTAPATAAANRIAYVTDSSSDSVTPIDIATRTAGSPIVVGSSTAGVAIVPDQAPTASFTPRLAIVGQATTFDASASTDSDGTVTRISEASVMARPPRLARRRSRTATPPPDGTRRRSS
jgi:hypothetical protein